MKRIKRFILKDDSFHKEVKERLRPFKAYFLSLGA